MYKLFISGKVFHVFASFSEAREIYLEFIMEDDERPIFVMSDQGSIVLYNKN